MTTEAQKEFEKLMASSKEVQDKAIAILTEMGETVELSDWVTIKEYKRRFGLESTNTVSNWIKRGIIPPENIRVFPEFNDLRLIKAVSYKETV